MKFKNKILKLSLRYAKEKGLYYMYLNKLRELINLGLNNEEKLINSCEYQTPLLIPQRARIIKGDIYSSDFIKYMCDMEQEKYIKLFDDFLEKYEVKEKYYQRIDMNFIRKHLFLFNTLENSQNIKEPFEIVKITYPPTGYIMHAFHWEKTIEGHEFWSVLNLKWIQHFICYIKQNS